MREKKFVNNSFFNESKFGYKIVLDVEELKKLKPIRGKYQIEALKSRNTGKWYLTEDDYEPKAKPTVTGVAATANPGLDNVATDDLPF